MHEPGEEYAGPALLHLLNSADAEPVPVEVQLRGAFQPIDGRFHWLGRIATPLDVQSGTDVVLSTEHGEAAGKLSDIDPWGRFRITGTGRPPF